MQIDQTLQQYFGFKTFRLGQKETVEAILEKNEVLSVLPTGTGKSVCYQLPSYLIEGVTIVVSPLISLMEDQIRQLQKIGEKRVATINGNLSQEEKHWLLSRLDQYKFIFMTPESLFQQTILSKIKQLTIGLMVIDEAHCISTWGIDFRPDYERLGSLLVDLDYPKVLALTATATPYVVKDIEKKLFKNRLITAIHHSVNRPNIYYAVETIEENQKKERIREFLMTYEGPGLIYCLTRKETELLSQYIQENTPLRSAYYHGAMSALERSNVQQQYISNDIDCLVATSAFGMGVDKPNIRYVIHYHFPNSLENFVQESGRAGRDGKQSISLILYDERDMGIHRYFNKELSNELKEFNDLNAIEDVEKRYSERQEKWLYYAEAEKESVDEVGQKITKSIQKKSFQLHAMLDYLNTATCRRKVILDYFDNQLLTDSAYCCDICQKIAFPLEKYKEKVLDEKNSLKNPHKILKKLFKS